MNTSLTKLHLYLDVLDKQYSAKLHSDIEDVEERQKGISIDNDLLWMQMINGDTFEVAHRLGVSKEKVKELTHQSWHNVIDKNWEHY